MQASRNPRQVRSTSAIRRQRTPTPSKISKGSATVVSASLQSNSRNGNETLFSIMAESYISKSMRGAVFNGLLGPLVIGHVAIADVTVL